MGGDGWSAHARRRDTVASGLGETSDPCTHGEAGKPGVRRLSILKMGCAGRKAHPF